MTTYKNIISDEERTGELVPVTENLNPALPQRLDILPMVELNVFPQLVYPISVEDPRAKMAVHRALDKSSPMALFAVKDTNVDPDDLRDDDFHPVGMAVRIHKVWEADNGNLKVVVQGLSRIRLMGICSDDNTKAMVETVFEDQGDIEALRPQLLDALNSGNDTVMVKG